MFHFKGGTNTSELLKDTLSKFCEMETDLKKYLNGSEWHIAELGWDSSRQGLQESIFALGNGYIGSRGVLEELPTGCQPGTYFAGLYDSTCAQVKELINVPNPISLQVSIGGEKLDISAMKFLDHERILDISKGVLYRRTLFQTAIIKAKILYQSIRFFSMANPHLAVLRVVLTPLDHNTTFTMKSAIDTSVVNAGSVTEGAKRHFLIQEYASSGYAKYVCTKTLENEVLLACAAQLTITKNNRTRASQRRKQDLTVKKGDSIILTKYFSLLTSNDVPKSKVKQLSLASLKRGVATGFEALMDRHTKAWNRLWDNSDIRIEGDPECLRAVRYNLYHLLITGSPHISEDVSIGARSLSGEGYRGHVFWDAEICILPFFVYHFPDIARRLLMYRYKRLGAARLNAKRWGYSGAMFPWESADTGDDVTPTWHKDLDGSIIKIHTMEYENHITADIAFAIWEYFQATNDERFFLDYGLEMLLETARFWDSRMIFDKKLRQYVIRNVMGPDEFHNDVDNNVYTNWMAKWNLNIALEAFRIGLQQSPKKTKALLRRLKLTQKQVETWHKVANKVYIPYMKRGTLLAQFDGFLKKKKYPLPDIDKSGLPCLPQKIPLEKIGQTQFVKQADVILLLFLFPSRFSREFIHRNLSFYEDRTLHKSSLSVSSHSVVAARIGLEDKAYRYLMIGARSDLDNVYGNTEEGIHAAAMGGTWQAIVKGFCGMKVENGHLSFWPYLPAQWKKIAYSLHWQGGEVDLAIDTDEFRIRWRRPKRTKSVAGEKTLPVYIFGELQTLQTNRWYSFVSREHRPSAAPMKGVF